MFIKLKVSITSDRDVSEAAESEALAPLISSRDLTAILGRSGLWIVIRVLPRLTFSLQVESFVSGEESGHWVLFL